MRRLAFLLKTIKTSSVEMMEVSPQVDPLGLVQ
jgi:hypothetical protein